MSPLKISTIVAFDYIVVIVQSVSCVWLFATHGQQHARLPCPSLSPGVCSDSCPLSQWWYLTISSYAALTPFAFNLSQHQGLFQWVSSLDQGAKVEREHDTIFLFFTWLPISCFYPGRCFCKLSPVYTFSKAKEKGCILFLHSFWFFILHWQKEMENVVVQSKWRIPLVSG